MRRKSNTRDLTKPIGSKLSALTDQHIEEFFSVNLKWLHRDPDFSKVKRDKRNSKQFLSWLETMSQLEWKKINVSDRSKQGWEKIEQSSLNFKVPTDFLTDTVLSFHWWGSRSIVGVRKQGVFCPFSVELDASDNKNYNH
jgi:hypothetical protein